MFIAYLLFPWLFLTVACLPRSPSVLCLLLTYCFLGCSLLLHVCLTLLLCLLLTMCETGVLTRHRSHGRIDIF